MVPLGIPQARKIFLCVMIGIALAVAATAPFSKIRVDVLSFSPLLYLAAICIGFSLYCHVRGMKAFGVGLEVVGFGFFITLPVLVMTYFVIGFGFPLADARLDAMDRVLGFDWLSYVRFVDERPLLSRVLFEAYQTISFQLLLIPLVLVIAKRAQRAYAMMAGYATLCMLSSLIAMFYPALGTYAYYGLSAHDMQSINPFFALSPVPDFLAVRDRADYTLSLGSAAGLLCFPSVHAGVACLCAWACWDLKWARYPMLALNAAMTAAAVSHANHYLVDIVAGLGLASLVIAAMKALFYRRPAPVGDPAMRRSPAAA